MKVTVLDRDEEDTMLGLRRVKRVREEEWRNVRKRGQEMNGDELRMNEDGWR
jgi:hypothetical protein